MDEGAIYRCGVELSTRSGLAAPSPTSEVSAEWTAGAQQIWPYLVPENGRVGGMLPHLKSPPWLDEWWASGESADARRRYSRVPRVRELPWEGLPRHLQEALICHAARADLRIEVPAETRIDQKKATEGFFAARDAGISRLTLRGELPVSVTETRSAFGRLYEPGPHRIKLEDLLVKRQYDAYGVFRGVPVLEPLRTLLQVVEPGEHDLIVITEERSGSIEHGSYASLREVLNGDALRKIQLHLRSRPGEMTASDMIRGIRLLAEATRMEDPSLHMHLVENLPWDILLNGEPPEKIAVATSMVDFIMRINDFEEFRAVLEGAPVMLRRETTTKAAVWGCLEANHFHRMFLPVFLLTTLPESWPVRFPFMGDEFKAGYIGVHWSAAVVEKYDRRGTWGLHVRTLSPEMDPESHYALVDSLQARLALTDYRQATARVTAWTGMRPGNAMHPRDVEKLREKHAKARWNQPWEVLFAAAPALVRAELNDELKAWLERQTEFELHTAIQQDIATHLELKWLVHDFSQQLEYFDNPARVKTIQEAQVKALKAVRAVSERGSAHDVMPIMQQFLIDSGLFDDRARYLKLRWNLQRPPRP